MPTAANTGAWHRFGAAAIDVLAGTEGADDSFAAARAALHDDLAAGSSAFAIIAANAGLAADDAEVLAVLATAEADPRLHLTLARLQGDASRNRYTIGTVMELFSGVPDHRGVRSLGADAPLRVSELVSVGVDGPWADHVVAVHPTVVWALVGDTSLDRDLPRIRAFVESDDPNGAPLVVVSGPDRTRRRQAAALALAGTRCFVVALPRSETEWSAVVREATLTGNGIILELDDQQLDTHARRTIDRATHLSWALSSTRDLPLDDLPDRPWVGVVADETPISDDEWRAAFGDNARTHPLRPEQLDRIVPAFHAFGGDLDAAVRRLGSGQLERMARRIRPSRTWDDLVLAPDRKRLLHTIVDRYRHADLVLRDWGLGGSTGRGTVALFAGPSGTGKTLAAEIITGELGLDLFKIDLSSIVSKYIGETEKNLEVVFETASAGNLVLFFDEADALFGKRSEVRDARDRYANIEVSYLLQRLEAYDGLVVMATNFEKNVDAAFLRRIHVRVQFEVPGEDERAAIWRASLPAPAPIGALDVDLLASRFEITGGIIRNAAVHAGFIAAASGTDITTEAAVRGIAREYRKLGRLVKAPDFDGFLDLVGED